MNRVITELAVVSKRQTTSGLFSSLFATLLVIATTAIACASEPVPTPTSEPTVTPTPDPTDVPTSAPT